MATDSQITISYLPPTDLTAYQREIPAAKQPLIPAIFHDSMVVRTDVFITEQNVPPESEFDADDPRSCHLVAYDTVKDADGITARKVPVGTVRIVPFPHAPHPTPEESYWSGVLKTDDPAQTGPAATPSTHHKIKVDRNGMALVDRATNMHDGREPYFKLGRLAVQKEYRGKGIADALVRTALKWISENATSFGSALVLTSEGSGESLKFKGLVCAHAQVKAIRSWARWGFIVDEEMGTWNEEGISHVGMFQRVPVSE
ncbi:hypothetical protein Cpir12675_004350 [Ceratocystis pirilliformis]|uniref:N-acetyltransferase domain-containing protein n=1 Tax=Ceratocystis pirilliformis TaxID=259994 RepID=A0ABR3YXY9_9PEZI